MPFIAGVKRINEATAKVLPSHLFSTGDERRAGLPLNGTWRSVMPEAMIVWWTTSSSIADAISDLSKTSLAEVFWTKCIREFVPRLPYFGLDYWIKFPFGDWLLHLAPSLAGYTIIGTGCFQHLSDVLEWFMWKSIGVRNGGCLYRG